MVKPVWRLSRRTRACDSGNSATTSSTRPKSFGRPSPSRPCLGGRTGGVWQAHRNKHPDCPQPFDCGTPTGWWVSGPYKETHLDAAPEILDADGSIDNLEYSNGLSSDATGSHAWRYVDARLHYLDLRREFDADGISAYALTRVYSSKNQNVQLIVRADGTVGVWVNGELAHSDPEGRVRTISDAADEIPMKLRSGWNSLLMKVVNAPGTANFELSVEFVER